VANWQGSLGVRMTDFLRQITEQFESSCQVKTAALTQLKTEISKAAELCCKCIRDGGTIYWAGNGGSAADAQHMAAELVGRYKRERKAIRSVALTTNTSNLTAIGNDYGYDRTFDRQLEAFVEGRDVLVAISTSGNSTNVIRAVELAKKVGAKIISLTGETGGKLAPLSDVLLNVPSKDTPRIQETHFVIEHILCDLIEQSVL
jgi:D-sedoheptulose 7-phosphate isomerase